jgi:putative FmdB family regulatory protein
MRKMIRGAGCKGPAQPLPAMCAGDTGSDFTKQNAMSERGANKRLPGIARGREQKRGRLVRHMPIYEYQCRTCEKEFQTLALTKEDEKNVKCPGCGGGDVKRLISRVVYHASEGDRLDAFDPNARQDDSFYKDSRNIGLSAKKRAKQMGIDLGSSFETKLDKLRTDPGSVLKDSD